MQSAEAISRAGKYLTFSLGREGFGIQIQKVREIIKYVEITGVPRSPHDVKGVINLRGQVISVVDLRTKFGLEERAPTDETCIIVVEVRGNGRTLPVGVVVDRVSEVIHIDDSSIEDAPAFGDIADSDFILGMGKVGHAVKVLLDIDRVIGAVDLIR